MKGKGKACYGPFQIFEALLLLILKGRTRIHQQVFIKLHIYANY